MRFAFIATEKASFGVVDLCRALAVSESGFYAWQKRKQSEHERKDIELRVLLKAFFEKSRRTYGSLRLRRDLADVDVHVGKNRILRLMREQNLKPRPRKRLQYSNGSVSTKPPAPNVLKRAFDASKPNQRWVGDTTELTTPSGRFYLAAIIDLYARYCVGWSVSALNDRRLVLGALEMAVRRRGPHAGLLHHSDQGSPYTSDEYQRALATYGIRSSMSRRGNCLDNAAMESWFSTLKFELGDHFTSLGHAKQSLFDYIEVFYNRQRRHSALDYLSPAEYEQLTKQQAAALRE